METNATQTVGLAPEQALQSKSTTAMVLGIVGLSLIILPGLNIIGLGLSIAGLVIAVKNRKLASSLAVKENDANKAGFVCGLIGTILGGLGVLLVFAAIALFAGLFSVAVATPGLAESITEALPQLESAIESAVPATGALNLLPSLFQLL